MGYFSGGTAVHGTTSGAFAQTSWEARATLGISRGVPRDTRGTTEVMGQTQGIEEGSDSLKNRNSRSHWMLLILVVTIGCYHCYWFDWLLPLEVPLPSLPLKWKSTDDGRPGWPGQILRGRSRGVP